MNDDFDEYGMQSARSWREEMEREPIWLACDSKLYYCATSPPRPVNDYGTDGIYFDALSQHWRVVYNNRLHACEWPYEYRRLAEQCFADLVNPPPEDPAHFHTHPYDYKQ